MVMTYQERYLAHQKRKKKMLIKLIKERHSDRVFSENPIDKKIIDKIIKSVELCPSSCDRRAVSIKEFSDRDSKALLGGLMVGGVGWIHRAPTVFLLFADQEAYKENLFYMPYLDAGVVIYHLYLIAECYGLKGCYINPNVREQNKSFFEERFGNKIFCGGFALGYA